MGETLNAPVVNRVLPPAGLQKGIIIGIAMLGTIEEPFEGHMKKQTKIRISWELPEAKHVFDENTGPESFVVDQEYTFSMGSKATLRKLLNGLAGNEGLSDAKAKEFNIADLIECEMYLNLVVKTSEKGNKRIEVAALSQIPQTEPELKRTKDTFLFTFTPPFKTEVFNKLPEYVTNKIKSSDEYKQMYGSHATQSSSEPASMAPVGGSEKKRASPF